MLVLHVPVGTAVEYLLLQPMYLYLQYLCGVLADDSGALLSFVQEPGNSTCNLGTLWYSQRGVVALSHPREDPTCAV